RGRAGGEREVAHAGVTSEEHHRGPGELGDDHPRDVKTAEPGHRVVEDDQIGAQDAREAQRGRTVARLADDRDLALGREERADALADGEMIVGDENADHRSCSPFSCARADVWKLCWGASRRASRARGRSGRRDDLRAATSAFETGSKRKTEVEPGLKPARPRYAVGGSSSARSST